jgi:hypothetical protein
MLLIAPAPVGNYTLNASALAGFAQELIFSSIPFLSWF